MRNPLLRAVARCLCVAALGASPSLFAQVLDKTPVLHLSFDNVSASTVINDGSGGAAMNGTLNGTGATIVPGGQFGNCLSISGASASDASCRIANAVVPLNVGAGNAWTVAMWVQTYTAGACYAYQGSGGWDQNDTSFYLNQGSDGAPGTKAGGVRAWQGWEQGTTDINDGAWHHLVLTCAGTTKALYVDGVLETLTKDEWSGTGAGNQFWIGGNGSANDNSVNLNGLIDEAYVFNRALSVADVQLLFTNNTIPTVPVAVTVNPTSGYRGQVITITATATPAVGTVTNASVNLSSLGLSATANLGLSSSPNVFTNSFTVPNNTNALIGASVLTATVISDEPLAGSGGASYTVLARPPTNAIVLTQVTSASVYEYTEASFHFAATNDAPNDAPFPMAYAWYKGGTLVSSNMGPNYTFLTTPADNGTTIYAIASVANTNYSSLTVASAVVTLTVNSGSLVYTNVLKREFFAGAYRSDVEIGNVGPGVVGLVTNADSLGGYGDNYTARYSGYFIPPADDAYVFFVASDDDADVFISPDSNPANKVLVAQETDWNGTRGWVNVTGTGCGVNSITSQRRSDQWTNSIGEMPYPNGFSLLAGQKYYLEVVHHNGSGGDNLAVTYQTTNEIADPYWSYNFTNGAPSRLNATNNNIALVTFPGSSIMWATQPQASVTVYEGQSTNFSASATSDAEMIPNYQWFIVTNGGAFPGTPLTGLVANGTNTTLSLIPANYDDAQIYCVASTEEGGLSITSSVCTLHVLQAVFEAGYVSEKKWMDVNIMGAVEAGTAPAPTFTCARPGFEAGLDNPGSAGRDNTIQQMGYFVAPTNGNYVFFITSHDGGDLFLSTDKTPANKRLIAQEAGWSGNWLWNQAGGGGSVVSQKRSDQYSPDSGATTPYSAGILLVAGQHYYMEVVHGTSRYGNEQVGVTYRVMDEYSSVTAPADGTYPNCVGSVVGMSAVRCSYVTFTQQPTNVTATPMGYATFSAAGATDSQYPICSAYGLTVTAPTNAILYQWYNGTNAIPGANSQTLTLGPLMPAANGMHVYCKMRALGYADDSLNPIWTNSQTATITLSQQAVFEPGVVMVDWWTNNDSRTSVEDGSAGNPTFSFVAPNFESPSGSSSFQHYVNRASGFFMAPSNGVYVFFVNGDGDSDLFINTNGSPVGKQLVAQETGWSPFRAWSDGRGGSTASQKRSDSFTPDAGATYPGNPNYVGGIPLVAGQVCWLEGVHHIADWGQHLEATYKEYNEANPVNGDASRLASVIGNYVPRIPWVAFLQQPTNQTVMSGGNSATFTVHGTNPPSVWIGTTGNPGDWLTNPPTASLQYQWYKKTVAGGAFVPIAGATSSSYTLPYALPSDQNAQFVCGLRALGYADDSLNRIYSNSVPAVLTVVTDTVPPVISYAATFQNTNQNPSQIIVNITFSKTMDASTLSNATYTIGGVIVTNVSTSGNHRTVQLLVDTVPTLPLVVTVNGVTDLSGNALGGSSTTNINAETLNFSDVGTPGTDPAYPSYIWVTGNGGYIVSAQGHDIWDNADGFDFGWELKTNDFDVVVRQLSIEHTSRWAKGGLMVRESLDPASREWSIVNGPLNDGVQSTDGSGTGVNDVECIARGDTAGGTGGWDFYPRTNAPAYPNAWVRLKRTGNVLDAFYSTNGVAWIHAATTGAATNTDGSVINPVYVGLCTTAHHNDVVSDPAPSPFLYYNTMEYADYNSSYIDAAPLLFTPVINNGSLSINWTNGGHLEASPVLGPGAVWTTVSTTNPAVILVGTTNQFFRVVRP